MSKKMPKADRRAQMLVVARMIVREQGTDALTLAALADRAGVSKPIAYNHFETRAGLMVALYKEIMDRQIQVLADALEQTPRQLTDVAWLMSETYMDCYESVGAEWHAIGAALKGDAAMDAYQKELIDRYVAFFSSALAPVSELSVDIIKRRCIGIVGAGEALSEALVRERITRNDAVEDYAKLISSWLASDK